MTTSSGRTADYAIDHRFLDRWSPRAFTGEIIRPETLMTILEAARWAPSGYNSQPWRFAWALRGTPHFDTLLSGLNAGNQAWAKNASALVFIASKTTFAMPGATEAKPSLTHSFDAGAAWALLSLETMRQGLHAHAMIGLEFATAAEVLKLPADQKLEAAVAIGRKGDPATLPDALRAREAPNQRKPLGEIAAEGVFPQG